jgi:hypothetical protein
MPRLARTQIIRGGSSEGGFYFALHGLDQIQNFLERASGEDLDEEMEEAVDYELQQVLGISQRYVPVDTGYLKSTGGVSVTRTREGFITGIVYYDTDYAIYVHENPDAQHAAPTQWKFLEIAFQQRAQRMRERIVEGVRRAIRRASR